MQWGANVAQDDEVKLDVLSIEQLRLFVIAAGAKSFSEVARACGKTQSSISVAINNLEVDIGVQLFDRGNQGIKLSAAGKALLPAANDILSRLKLFEQRAIRLSECGTDQFTLHVDALFPYAKVVTAVTDLERRHPETEIAVKIEPPFTAFRNWLGKTEDLIISSRSLAVASGTDVRGVEIGQEHFVPVAARTHELGCKMRVEKKQLSTYRQVVFDVGRKVRQQSTGSRSIFVDGLDYQKSLILSGAGWGYLPKHLIREEIDKGDLVTLRLTDESYYPQLSFRMAWHSVEPLSGIKRELVDMLTPEKA